MYNSTAATASSACTADHGKYAADLLGMYSAVTSYITLNFHGARVPIRTNLHLEEWSSICTPEEDATTLSYLTYKFPAGYEGPVPTPSQANQPSAINHRWDVVA